MDALRTVHADLALLSIAMKLLGVREAAQQLYDNSCTCRREHPPIDGQQAWTLLRHVGLEFHVYDVAAGHLPVLIRDAIHRGHMVLARMTPDDDHACTWWSMLISEHRGKVEAFYLGTSDCKEQPEADWVEATTGNYLVSYERVPGLEEVPLLPI